MRITLKNNSVALTIDCETYSINPQFSNVWFSDFASVVTMLEHRVCEAVRVSVMNNCYDSWRIGFKTEDIKIET